MAPINDIKLVEIEIYYARVDAFKCNLICNGEYYTNCCTIPDFEMPNAVAVELITCFFRKNPEENMWVKMPAVSIYNIGEEINYSMKMKFQQEQNGEFTLEILFRNDNTDTIIERFIMEKFQKKEEVDASRLDTINNELEEDYKLVEADYDDNLLQERFQIPLRF
jgi:hypothetical protein